MSRSVPCKPETHAWLPLEAWEAYLEHRRKLRKPLTAYGEKLAIGRLADLREQGHDPLKVLNEAILMGWQGLWCNERTREDVKPKPALQVVEVPIRNWRYEYDRKKLAGEIPKGMDIDEWKKSIAK